MYRALQAISLLLSVLVSVASLAASPVHKCEVDGKVTYQNSPCPSGEQPSRPTHEQIKAEHKKRAALAASAAAASSSKTEPRTKPAVPTAPPPPAEIKGGFRCDGRVHCSQMTSCAEAKYFLANCPGVKMDGDRNGVPCERQ